MLIPQAGTKYSGNIRSLVSTKIACGDVSSRRRSAQKISVLKLLNDAAKCYRRIREARGIGRDGWI